MRVLVLGIGFHPEVTALAPYTTDLCAYFVEQGHDVTAVVAFPHYPLWRVFDAYRGRVFLKEQVRGVRVFRVPMYIPRRPSTLRRIAYDSSFAISSLVAGGLVGGKPDLIVATCSPLQLGVTATLLGWRWRAPFVLHVQDLLPEGAIALGILRQRIAIKIANAMADFVYARACLVTAIGHGIIDALRARGVPPEKLAYLPNWVDPGWIQPGSRLNPFRGEVGVADADFVVLYVGNFGAKQQMETLVDTARLLQDDPSIKIVMVGDGARKAAAVRLAEEYGLQNLCFVGVQPRDRLPDILAAGDLHVLHQRREVVDIVVPSKLLSYAASARPILLAGASESEGARFVEAAGCGRVVAPEDPALLADAIRVLKNDPDGRQRLGDRARRYVEEHFTRDRVLAGAEDLFARTIDRGWRTSPDAVPRVRE